MHACCFPFLRAIAVELALVITTIVFVIVLLWRIRPLLPIATSATASERTAFAALKAQIEAAKSGPERSAALLAAGEAMAQNGRRSSAEGYFLRALREAPTSVAAVRRTQTALAKWPRTLESVLWRRLGSASWTGEHRPAVLAALEALSETLAGPLRKRVVSRALRHAFEALAAAPSDSV
jgi:hypothetical protein